MFSENWNYALRTPSRGKRQKLRAELIKAGLISEDGTQWHQMQWSKEQSQLLPTDGEKLGLQHRDVQRLVQKPGTVLRFHALKALQRIESRDGTVVVPWKLVMGLRTEEADELHAKPLRGYTAGPGQDETGHTASVPAGAKHQPNARVETAQGFPGFRDALLCCRFENRASGWFMNACTWAVVWGCTYLQHPEQAMGGLREVLERTSKVSPMPFRLMKASVFSSSANIGDTLRRAQGIKIARSSARMRCANLSQWPGGGMRCAVKVKKLKCTPCCVPYQCTFRMLTVAIPLICKH